MSSEANSRLMWLMMMPMTKMATKTSSQQSPDQVVYLYTVAQEAGLWYVALAAPSAEAGEFEPLAKQIVGTVQFPK